MFKKTVSLMLIFVLIFISVPNVVLDSSSRDEHLILLEQLLAKIQKETFESIIN